MYEQHSICNTPSDDSSVWHYLDFRWLEYILAGSLKFRRVDMFEDKWEGALPADLVKEPMSDVTRKYLQTTYSYRSYCYACCWHLSKVESQAMWKLYGRNGQTVAIKSTVGRLKQAIEGFPYSVFIGTVRYGSHQNGVFGEQDRLIENIFEPILFKDESFEFEKELRLILHSRLSEPYDGKDWEEDDDGRTSVLVDSHAMIESIFVSPFSGDDAITACRELLDRLNFPNVPVFQSPLAKPFFI